MSSSHNAAVSKIIMLAESHHLSADDLYMEADCADEYGEWQHICLMGFSGDLIREAADNLAGKTANAV